MMASKIKGGRFATICSNFRHPPSNAHARISKFDADDQQFPIDEDELNYISSSTLHFRAKTVAILIQFILIQSLAPESFQ